MNAHKRGKSKSAALCLYLQCTDNYFFLTVLLLVLIQCSFKYLPCLAYSRTNWLIVPTVCLMLNRGYLSPAGDNQRKWWWLWRKGRSGVFYASYWREWWDAIKWAHWKVQGSFPDWKGKSRAEQKLSAVWMIGVVVARQEQLCVISTRNTELFMEVFSKEKRRCV